MNLWKVILATLVIFGAGVLTGGLLVNHAHRTRPRPVSVLQSQLPVGQPGPVRESLLRTNILARFDKELNLTPEQRRRIEAIVTESQKHAKELSDTIAPQMREEVRRTRELVRAELTPEQRKKFEQLMKARQQRRPEESPAGEERRPRERPVPAQP